MPDGYQNDTSPLTHRAEGADWRSTLNEVPLSQVAGADREPPRAGRAELRQAAGFATTHHLAHALGIPESSVASFEAGRDSNTIGTGHLMRKFHLVATAVVR